MTYFSYLSFERKIFFSLSRFISERRLYSTEEIHELVLTPSLAFCYYNLQNRKQGTTTLLVTNPGVNEIQVIHEVETRNCSLIQPCPWAGMELHLQTWFRGTEAGRSLQD